MPAQDGKPDAASLIAELTRGELVAHWDDWDKLEALFACDGDAVLRLNSPF